MTERNIKIVVAYEGTQYLGWQKTKMGPSIQEELEKAIAIFLRHPVFLQAASRTDKGVHAKGQVVNFITAKPFKLDRFIYSLNCLLPPDIRVLSIEAKELSFHPTIDAIGKQYRYSIRNGFTYFPEERLFSWHITKTLNLDAMKKASTHFLGEHDFCSFCNEIARTQYEHTIRKVDRFDIVEETAGSLKIIVEGNHFLYKMVRNLVGAVVYAGLGKIDPEKIPTTLQLKKRIFAEVTAPAHGLSLHEIFYPKL